MISIFEAFLIFLMLIVAVGIGALACWFFLKKQPRETDSNIPQSIAELLVDIPGNASKLSQMPEDDLTDMQKQFLNFARYDGTSKGQIDVGHED